MVTGQVRSDDIPAWRGEALRHEAPIQVYRNGAWRHGMMRLVSNGRVFVKFDSGTTAWIPLEDVHLLD